ncbi:hypothetical protein AB6A40_011687 [Gnathostoma spinigerum]|uniref:Uncharacterized protein n=1 Tax=Gnathostoma spinigerum TaxID=75299 RepID=A0ABD6EYZ3_9BILA
MDVEKVAEYIEKEFIAALERKGTKYVCIAPFAYYLSADVTDGYLPINKHDLIKQQLDSLIISKITTFGPPLNKRFIIP